MSTPSAASTPRITALRVIPVAGHDDMLMNLSGAHGPFFTRNILVLTDSAGNTGVGEVPGGEKIRQTLQLPGHPEHHAHAVCRARQWRARPADV